MTDGPRPLASRLRAGEALRLLFVKAPAPAEVELAGAVGFDAVILDTEHGSPDGLEEHLRAADAAGVPALVRVPTVDPAAILRALDAGAVGIVAAHVTDPALAAAAVAAAHYPPRGRRGLALTTRAGRHGTTELAEHLSRAAQETVVLVQIEDAEAVEHAEAIAAVDGVDGVLIGATDLSLSLGHPGEPEHPEVADAIATISRAAEARGVALATVVSSAAQADTAGAQVTVFVASLLIRDAFRSAAAPLGSGGHPGAAPAPLILLPGMFGTAALWDELAPMLRDLAPLRFGRIDLDSSIDEMADSVLASAPERFALAGHSLGAIVALAVVRRAPDRVTALGLLHGSARPPTEEALAVWDELERRAEEDFLALVDDLARDWLPQTRRDDQALHGQIAAMSRACGPRVLARQLAAQRSRVDQRPGLAGIACPTLVVSGAEDSVSPPERQDELAAAISGAELVCLERVGHYSPLEAPDRVAAAFARWLS